MKRRQNSNEIAKRLNDIGPHSNQKKVEGLARSVADRIANGDPPPPGYKKWEYAIMQFYRPMRKTLNDVKKLAAKGSI